MDSNRFKPYRRRTIRLREFDYSLPGGCFFTISSFQREFLFGSINEEKTALNAFGKIVQSCWDTLNRHYNNIDLGSFIIMPNHVHGIIVIRDSNIDLRQNIRAGLRPAPTKNGSLPEIIRVFKSFSTRTINELRKSPGIPVWQRNYYEHIIRDDEELGSIREYIENIPKNWMMDKENIELFE